MGIENLSDDLNRKIAELCGWTNIEEEDWFVEGWGDYGPVSGLVGVPPKADLSHRQPIPNYVNNLDDAIQLWTHIPDTHTPRLVRILVPKGVITYEYRAVILSSDGNSSDWEAQNTNPARAICDSWLQWKGVL